MGRTTGVVIVALAMLAGGCGVTDPDELQNGIVRFVDVEGGCWAIDVDEARLEPINLPLDFRLDGLPVLFSAEPRTDLGTICQIGAIVELKEIRVALE